MKLPLSFKIAWLTVLVGGLVITLCELADAGCPQVFSHRGAVAVQAVNVQPYYYSAQRQHTAPYVSSVDIQGILQTAAQIEQLKAGLLQIDAAAVSRLSGIKVNCDVERSPGNPAAKDPYLVPTGIAVPETALPQPVTNSSCVKCHSPGKASGGLDLSDLSKLDCETRMEMIRRVMLPEGDPEHMPKGGSLTAQQLGDFIGEASLLPAEKR